MRERGNLRPWLLGGSLILILFPLLKVLIHLPFLTQYGYFRDELYYIACSAHLDWGYVDQPPLSLVVLAGVRHFLGDSLAAIRIPAVCCGAITVFLTGFMARQMGGTRFAQVLASLAALTSPVILGNAGRYYSMNALDMLFWALAQTVVILAIKKDTRALWLLFGILVGLGLLNKYSMGFFVIALVVGLLLTPERRHLFSPFFWLGGAIAALLVFPHLLWEFRTGFPTLEFMHNAATLKNMPTTPWEFFLGQLRESGYGNAPLWIGGLLWLVVSRPARPYRLFAVMYGVLFLLMALQNAKAYYLSPIYPVLFASGGCSSDALLTRLNWVKPVIIAFMLVSAVLVTPFTLPVLPVETYIAYQKSLGVTIEREERGAVGILPQHYADMFGWREMADTVARVYESLRADEQKQCLIYVRNYGEAAAIDFFGRSHHLPPVACTHNSYWFWKPGSWTGQVSIIFGSSNDTAECFRDFRQFFDQVELAAFTRSPYAMPYESNRPIFICRGAHITLDALWERDKRFI